MNESTYPNGISDEKKELSERIPLGKEKYLYLIFKIVKTVCRGHPSFNGKTVLKSFNLLLTRQPAGLKIPTYNKKLL